MIITVTLVFHPNGRLYFSSQVRRLQQPSEAAGWEAQGYLVRHVDVDLPIGALAPELVSEEGDSNVG